MNLPKTENSSMVGITEILLSLLAQKKALLKKLSLIIWQQFIGDVGLKELQILLDVLKTRENKQGFALLFEGEGEFEEVDEEESAVEDESKVKAKVTVIVKAMMTKKGMKKTKPTKTS